MFINQVYGFAKQQKARQHGFVSQYYFIKSEKPLYLSQFGT